MMTRLELRCCCDPRRLLGFIQLPTSRCYDGATVRFAQRVDPIARYSWNTGQLVAPMVELTVAAIQFGEQRPYLAVKSNHLELKDLRRIPGFEEHVPA